ncbi:facilitated trehalose transporter Tret1-2 homolog [Uranotaenia lowii]|uniref:facilitated trehalose transporter Tret1-2 homolog n=1 Tax=Uranotaenia lowii TaxID=190385 RepID=UPI0024785AA5|nr:facilitated trehalose transporter Tret1-2 homolog [Uranotaenia lowii]XP_055587581.1 facilitated trehalose transporter Tret1-2 homolog [Uranotaenia lowii]XP_055587582.1 facilitated trehalose transporter Tret1-2 homolog [Uranotaenia lowii]
MSNNEPGVTHRMLYDPPEGQASNSKLMQFVAGVGVSFAAISAGTALGWTSPVLPQLTEPNNTASAASDVTNSTDSFYLTADQQSWVGAFLAVGAFVGALPAGFLAEKIGRKFTTMSLAIPYLISWVLIIFANGAEMLYAGRFIIGIATGASCVVAPMFISEIAETAIRGTLGAFFQLFLTVGILFVYAIGPYVSWVLLSVLCAIFPAVLIVAMIFVKESPTYLVKQGRRSDAAVALRWFWGKNCNTQNAVEAIQSDLDAVKGEARLSDLFTKTTNRNALFMSLLLMFFQQFSGINAVIFYTVQIFKAAGSTMDPAICAIVVGVVQVLMTFVSAVLIDKAGRRILLLQSSFVMGSCLIVLGVYFNLQAAKADVSNIGWLPLASVVLFIVSFSLGFGPIPWMMMGELCAADIKGIATALSVMFNWTLVFIVTKTFGTMQEVMGADWTFWFFGIWMMVCTVYVFFKIPETKGKTNAEIQAILGGKN